MATELVKVDGENAEFLALSGEFSPDNSDFIANILLEAPNRDVLIVTKTEMLCADISRAVYRAVILDKEYGANIIQMQKKFFSFTVDGDQPRTCRTLLGLSADMQTSVYPRVLSASHIFVFF